MKIVLLLIFLFVNLSKEKNLRNLASVLKIPIKYSNKNQPLIKVCIGTPVQCFNFKLATNSNFCFIFDKNYKKEGFSMEKSRSIQIETRDNFLTYKDYEFRGDKVTDTFYLEGEEKSKLNSFAFYIIKSGNFEDNDNYVGILGLGTFRNNSDLSLLNAFKNRKIILNTNFGIMKNYLFIGEYFEFKNKKFRIGKIISTQGSSYELDLNGIIFYNEQKLENTKIYNKTQLVFFSPGANKIYSPKKFFKYLQTEIFNSYLNNHLCKIENSTMTIKIICKKEFTKENLGLIKFFFGKWNISFKLNDLFISINNEENQFEIEEMKNDDRWVFGFPFFNKFDVIFDSENSLIKIKSQ